MVLFSRLTRRRTFLFLVPLLLFFSTGFIEAAGNDSTRKDQQCSGVLGQNTKELEVVRSDENVDWVKFREGNPIPVLALEEEDPLIVSASSLLSNLIDNSLRPESNDSSILVIAGQLELLPPKTELEQKEFAYDLLLEITLDFRMFAKSEDSFNVDRKSISIERLISTLMESLPRNSKPTSMDRDYIEDQIVVIASHVGSPSERKVLSATMIRGDLMRGRWVVTMYAIVNMTTGKMAQIVVRTKLPGELAN